MFWLRCSVAVSLIRLTSASLLAWETAQEGTAKKMQNHPLRVSGTLTGNL
jgi:hypothetical protein